MYYCKIDKLGNGKLIKVRVKQGLFKNKIF